MAPRKRPRTYTLGLRAPESEATRREWGGRLRDARERRGMTQADVAAVLGCTRQCVSNWERGASAPTLEQRNALAAILKRRAKSLFPDTERAA